MKKVFLSFCICAATFTAFAQKADVAVPAAPTQEAASPVADIKVVEAGITVSEETHDFGKIPQGKPVTTNFTITNASKTAFKLDNVQASCGCTTPVWNKDEALEPGKSTVITVGYNAAAPGVFTKPVTITYNGKETKMIYIKGEVWATPAASAPAPAADAKSHMGHGH